MSQTMAGLQSSEGFADLDVQENTLLGRSRCWLWLAAQLGLLTILPIHSFSVQFRPLTVVGLSLKREHPKRSRIKLLRSLMT